MDSNNDRIKFLLEFYNVCWNNITRAEDAAWKMMAAYATLIAGLSFIYKDIGAIGFLIIIIIFSYFSINISLNANLWFVRNMGIISNLKVTSVYSLFVKLAFKENDRFRSRTLFF